MLNENPFWDNFAGVFDPHAMEVPFLSVNADFYIYQWASRQSSVGVPLHSYIYTPFLFLHSYRGLTQPSHSMGYVLWAVSVCSAAILITKERSKNPDYTFCNYLESMAKIGEPRMEVPSLQSLCIAVEELAATDSDLKQVRSSLTMR